MKDTIKNKRKYTKPELELVAVDNEISLVMHSDPPPHQTSVGDTYTLSSSSEATTLKSISTTSSDETPFGGNSVDYGN